MMLIHSAALAPHCAAVEHREPGGLNEKVEERRKAPITGPSPYLLLDATFLDARWARKVENVSALVAYGIGGDGHRKLLAVTIGAEESEASWSELLAQLVERRLPGVHLVVADGHAGLAKAVRHHLPEAPLQRCTVHLLRNVFTKAPQRLRARLARAVSNVFEAPSKAEAQKRVDALNAGLGKQVPEAMKCLEEGFAAAAHFYAFPREHWHRIRSTNGLERLHGEIKRLTRAVGAFSDRASALRLVTAVALQVTSATTLPPSLFRRQQRLSCRNRTRTPRSFAAGPFHTWIGTRPSCDARP